MSSPMCCRRFWAKLGAGTLLSCIAAVGMPPEIEPLLPLPTIELAPGERFGSATVLLRNCGSEPVHILQAQPSCWCVTVQLPRAVIEPDSVVLLRLWVNRQGLGTDTLQWVECRLVSTACNSPLNLRIPVRVRN